MSLYRNMFFFTKANPILPGAAAASSSSKNPELLSSSRYPKRKRAEVRYCSSDNDSDSDMEDLLIKKRARPRTSSKPLPKNKIFPFMSLSAELRNKIYKECLPDPIQNSANADDTAIWFRPKQKAYRRSIEQITSMDQINLQQIAYSAYYDFHAAQRGTGREWPQSTDREEDSDVEDETESESAPKSLGLNILAVCKTIYREAAPMFYSQHLVFLDTDALMAFASCLSPTTAKLLRHIEIRVWTTTRTRKNRGYAAMAMLAAKGVTNLDKLHLNCNIDNFASHSWRVRGGDELIVKRTARNVYRACYDWLEVVGLAKGDYSAGVEILKIGKHQFNNWVEQKWKGGAQEKEKLFQQGEKIYKKELLRLLAR